MNLRLEELFLLLQRLYAAFLLGVVVFALAFPFSSGAVAADGSNAVTFELAFPT